MSPLRQTAFLSCMAFFLLPANTAHAIGMKECSAKYDAARKGGSPITWSEFRTSECGVTASQDEAPETPPSTSPTKIPEGVTFPGTVDAKFSHETPAKQRMKTCLESYRANKQAKSLAGMRWVQKGGGYYSVCNARLKGKS